MFFGVCHVIFSLIWRIFHVKYWYLFIIIIIIGVHFITSAVPQYSILIYTHVWLVESNILVVPVPSCMVMWEKMAR